jgi:hypothetical protein
MSADQLQQAYAAAGIQSAAKGRQTQQAVIWKQNGDNLAPVQVATGLTDHVNTAVTKVMAGSLTSGDTVVTGSTDGTKTAAAPKPSSSPATPRVGGGRMATGR